MTKTFIFNQNCFGMHPSIDRLFVPGGTVLTIWQMEFQTLIQQAAGYCKEIWSFRQEMEWEWESDQCERTRHCQLIMIKYHPTNRLINPFIPITSDTVIKTTNVNIVRKTPTANQV